MTARPMLLAGVAALAAGLATAGPTAATPPPAGAPGHPAQATATLVRPLAAYAGPSTAPRRITTLAPRRPVTGAQTVLPVTDTTVDGAGTPWVKVMLPGRPNGRRAWARRADVVLGSTRWRVRIDTTARQVRVLRDGRVARTFRAIVGKPLTPTPHGDFFVEESVRMPAGRPGAPFALLLSARSEVLRHFEGGVGQIAVHGVRGLGGTPGTAVSHGCVRLGDAAITWLAAQVGPGTPVTISGGAAR